MVPVSIFLLFVGCMVVNCNLVGHGGHWLINNKIVKLNGNTKIAENPDDLKLYKELEGSCDVEMVEGNIRIWYQKNTPTANKGCSIDLVTKNVDQLPLRFGIWHKSGLTECLPENILPFSISLNNTEFENIKKIFETDNRCEDVKPCDLDQTIASLNTQNSNDEKHTTVQTSLDLVLNENLFEIKDCNSKSALSCKKRENLRMPEIWEIKDEDYNNKGFKSLFTFHLLPLNAARMNLNNFLKLCGKNETDEAKFQRCDKMFIEFDKENIKMLVPKTGDTEIGNSTTIQETTGTTTEPTTKVTTEASGMKSSIVILIIIVVIVLILVIIGLVYYFIQKATEEKVKVAVDKKKEMSTNIGETSVGTSTDKKTSAAFGSPQTKFGRGNVGDQEKKKTLGSASRVTGTKN
uniref:Uncharacterized protein n=1 Tax=Meloidogyne javanica TaxID=6303 RepID=A0A915LT45_MELJA